MGFALVYFMHMRGQVPNKIRLRRQLMGYEQIELANEIGLQSSNRISDWENGIAVPSLANALKLSRVLKVLVEDLYSDFSAQLCKDLPMNSRITLQ